MGIANSMMQDHERIATLLRDLGCAAESGERSIVLESWHRLEPALLAHFESEERNLLPNVRREHAREADAILREHEELRRKLDRLGVAAELHTLRQRDIEAMISELEAHAKAEDETA